MSEWINRLRSAFDGLAPRERTLVSVAGGLLLVALAYLLVVSPIMNAISRGDTRAETAQQELQAMQRLEREYLEVSGQLSSVEARIAVAPLGNLRTTLETLATQAAVKVESMEPQASPANETYKETKVEVALKSVSLAQAVTYLTGIESAPQVLSVKSLRMRKRPDKTELLDVTFTVSSFEPI
jgi:type II secretory pathway component PulM